MTAHPKLKWKRRSDRSGLAWVADLPIDSGEIEITHRVTAEWLVWHSLSFNHIGQHHTVSGAKAIAQWYADSLTLRGGK